MFCATCMHGRNSDRVRYSLPRVTNMHWHACYADMHQIVQVLTDTRAIYLNGCLFDELPSDMVLSALLQAKNSGAVICFDPGPR